MRLVVADLHLLQTLCDRGALERVLRSCESLSVLDFVEWGILDGRDTTLKDWRARNAPRFAHVGTAFSDELDKRVQAWILARKPEGLRPEPDYGLLTAWAAANIADDVRAGRVCPDGYEVLVEQEDAVALLSSVGVTIRTSAWASRT